MSCSMKIAIAAFVFAGGSGLAGCAGIAGKSRVPAQAVEYAKSIFADVPNPKAFRGWRENTSYVSSPVPYDRLRKAEFRCDEPTLYPTHPSQAMKRYHVFKVGEYDHFKLNADDEACRRGAPRASSSGRKFCLMPDYLEYAVVSDLYEDACGHTYRAFKEVLFLKKNETMGSLFSAGRASIPNPKSSDAGDMVDGHTYPVTLKEFLFVIEPFPGEAEKARALRAEALSKTHRYDEATRTFQRRDGV